MSVSASNGHYRTAKTDCKPHHQLTGNPKIVNTPRAIASNFKMKRITISKLLNLIIFHAANSAR